MWKELVVLNLKKIAATQICYSYTELRALFLDTCIAPMDNWSHRGRKLVVAAASEEEWSLCLFLLPSLRLRS